MLNALRLNEGFTVRDYRQRTGLEIESLEAKLADARGRGVGEPRGRVAADRAGTAIPK